MGQQDLRKNRVHQQRNQAALLHARSRSGAGGRFSVCSSWFDVRVLYARVVSCFVDEAPELLTMWFPARGIDLALEVNGGRIAPSEEACIALRRDRLDTESEEVTFVSTDNIRTSGSLAFEIYHRHEFLVSGSLKQSVMPASGSRGGHSSSLCEGGMFSGMRKLGWRMECSCESGSSKCSFVRVQSHHIRSSMPPSSSSSTSSSTLMEVCVVGRYIGSPVILTQTVQLNARRSRLRCAVLDVIPEDEECCSTATPTGTSRCFIAGGGSFGDCFVTDQHHQQQQHHHQLGEKFADAADGSGASAAIKDEEHDSSNNSNSGRRVGDDDNDEQEHRDRHRRRRRRHHSRRDGRDDDDDDDDDEEDELRKLYESEAGVYEDGGEVSWFNAGVRVGVGIGLGMCLGVGLGVGLMVRTYNATTRSFRRGIL